MRLPMSGAQTSATTPALYHLTTNTAHVARTERAVIQGRRRTPPAHGSNYHERPRGNPTDERTTAG